jgi:hypothetical protein
MHSNWAVTADHCVKRLAIGDSIELVDADKTTFEGMLFGRCKEKDLALIQIVVPQPEIRIPPISAGVDKAFWRTPCRPTEGHPLLTGSITNSATRFHCVGGSTLTALQLLSHQELGDFSGYSGSPIQQEEPDNTVKLVGLLIEQHISGAEPRKATNVIWAASIAEVIDEFNTELEDGVLALLEEDGERLRRERIKTWVKRGTRDLGYALEALEEYSMEAGAHPAALSVMAAYLPKRLLNTDDSDSFGLD